MVVIKKKTCWGDESIHWREVTKPSQRKKIILNFHQSLYKFIFKNDFPPTFPPQQAGKWIRAARRVLPCAQIGVLPCAQIQVLPCAQIQSCGSTFCPQRLASAGYMSPTSATALFFRIKLALLKYHLDFQQHFLKWTSLEACTCLWWSRCLDHNTLGSQRPGVPTTPVNRENFVCLLLMSSAVSFLVLRLVLWFLPFADWLIF